MSELGRGGMGMFTRPASARSPPGCPEMLLRVPPPAPSSGTFRTEAEAMARLHHPNIVQIYEVSECEGQPYFAMEFVPGHSLGQVLDALLCPFKRPRSSSSAWPALSLTRMNTAFCIET